MSESYPVKKSMQGINTVPSAPLMSILDVLSISPSNQMNRNRNIVENNSHLQSNNSQWRTTPSTPYPPIAYIGQGSDFAMSYDNQSIDRFYRSINNGNSSTHAFDEDDKHDFFLETIRICGSIYSMDY